MSQISMWLITAYHIYRLLKFPYKVFYTVKSLCVTHSKLSPKIFEKSSDL